jgi:hypothetical protein
LDSLVPVLILLSFVKVIILWKRKSQF